MIRPERLTVKAAEALQQASALAARAAILSSTTPTCSSLCCRRTMASCPPAPEDRAQRRPAQLRDGTGDRPLPEAVWHGRRAHAVARSITVLDRADEEAKALGDAYVSTEHLLLACWKRRARRKQLLAAAGVDRGDLMAALEGVRGSHRVTDQEPEQKYQGARAIHARPHRAGPQGQGRPRDRADEEIRRVMQVLSRRTKNNPVLIGEPGSVRRRSSKGWRSAS